MISTKFPKTHTERLELGPDAVHIPASWEEYLDLLETCEYPLVMAYTRIDDSNRWVNEDFDDLEQTMLLEGMAVPVKDFYKKVGFDRK